MLTAYFLRIAPGLAVFAALLAMVPKRSVPLRIAIYIMLFVLFRDAMTPAGLWSISREGSISLTSDPVALIVLGTLSGIFVLFVPRTEPQLRELVVWAKGSRIAATTAGLIGAVAVATPAIVLSHQLPEPSRPAAVVGAALPALLYVLAIGNVLEEVMFRGWLQGFLEHETTPRRAAGASALAFASGHAFLATTVTDLGIPILLFTLYEGIVTASLRLRWGVFPASLAHGGAIFLIASHHF